MIRRNSMTVGRRVATEAFIWIITGMLGTRGYAEPMDQSHTHPEILGVEGDRASAVTLVASPTTRALLY